jgi:hypothetical protein
MFRCEQIDGISENFPTYDGQLTDTCIFVLFYTNFRNMSQHSWLLLGSNLSVGFNKLGEMNGLCYIRATFK